MRYPVFLCLTYLGHFFRLSILSLEHDSEDEDDELELELELDESTGLGGHGLYTGGYGFGGQDAGGHGLG